MEGMQRQATKEFRDEFGEGAAVTLRLTKDYILGPIALFMLTVPSHW